MRQSLWEMGQGGSAQSAAVSRYLRECANQSEIRDTPGYLQQFLWLSRLCEYYSAPWYREKVKRQII